MIRFSRALFLLAGVGCVAFAQTPRTTPNSPPEDRSGAYYNFAMGRLYAELAGAYGNSNEYISKAIQYYQEALKQDPSAGIIFEELTDIYIQTGRLRDAVTEAESLLKQNPENLDARRMLGRIYTRMIGDAQQGKINEDMLRRATEQYQKITEKDPKDAESWVILGRLYRVANDSVNSEKAYNNALKVDASNEDALTGLAMLYSDLGDTKRAIEKLKAATDKNPEERTLVALATAYEQTRDFKDAADALRRALAAAPDNKRIRRGLAQDLFFSEQLDEALTMYQQLATEDPKDTVLRLRMSEIYRAKHDFAKAQEALKQAKALDPDNLEVRYAEVNLLEAQGKSDQAIASLKMILDSTAKKNYSAAEASNRAMLLEKLGVLYRDSNQYPQAIDAFRQISALDSEGAPRVAVQIIDTYRAAKDFDTAAKEADAALKKFPNERMVIMAHASLMADRGKVDEAVSEVRGTTKGQEPDRETLLALAQLYEKGKRYADEAKALDDAAKLSKAKSDTETIDFMRGAMYERMKKYDAAETEFQKVLQANPENSGALNYLGYMLANRSMRLDEAYQLIKKAVDLDPDNGAYLDSLGWVYYQQGKLNEAEAPLLRAVERIGDDPTVHDHLGDLYFKLGKTKEAISQWQTSIQRYRVGAPSEVDPEDMAKINKKIESARVRLAKETNQK